MRKSVPILKRKKVGKLKLTNSCLALFMSAAVLSGCSEGDKIETSSSEELQTSDEKVVDVKKHEVVSVPVVIFKDSNYKIEGQQVTFSRSITNVEFKDFDEPSEIEFFNRYDSAVRSQGFDLQKDYKLLVISLKHEVQEEARSKPYEAYLLSDGSGLVIGDEELALKNEFLRYQQEFLTRDYNMGTTSKEQGKMLLAVPNEFAKDKNLQLKIVQKLDNENKYIYIDLH